MHCLNNTQTVLLSCKKSMQYLVKELFTKDCMTELRKEQNRYVIKKFLMTNYLMAQKKWALRETLSDIITFLKPLGDVDIKEHLQESSTQATYVSTASADKEEGWMENETIEIAVRA